MVVRLGEGGEFRAVLERRRRGRIVEGDRVERVGEGEVGRRRFGLAV